MVELPESALLTAAFSLVLPFQKMDLRYLKYICHNLKDFKYLLFFIFKYPTAAQGH